MGVTTDVRCAWKYSDVTFALQFLAVSGTEHISVSYPGKSTGNVMRTPRCNLELTATAILAF